MYAPILRKKRQSHGSPFGAASSAGLTFRQRGTIRSQQDAYSTPFSHQLRMLLYLYESCPLMCLLHSDTVNDIDLRALFPLLPKSYKEDWMSFRLWPGPVHEAAQLSECGVDEQILQHDLSPFTRQEMTSGTSCQMPSIPCPKAYQSLRPLLVLQHQNWQGKQVRVCRPHESTPPLSHLLRSHRNGLPCYTISHYANGMQSPNQ